MLSLLAVEHGSEMGADLGELRLVRQELLLWNLFPPLLHRAFYLPDELFHVSVLHKLGVADGIFAETVLEKWVC